MNANLSEIEEAQKKAEQAFCSGRLDEAESLSRRIIAADCRSVRALFLLGRVAVRTERSELAHQLFSKALRLEPAFLQALTEASFSLLRTGPIGEAIALCRHAIRLRPEDPGGYFCLGLCMLTAKRLSKAAECFRRAISLDPAVAKFHHHLGIALHHNGESIEAEEAYERSISLDPDARDSYSHLGELLLAKGDTPRGIYCCRRAYEIAGDTPWGLLQLARALLKEKRFEDAESCLRGVAAVEPESIVAHLLLGAVMQRTGDFQQANASFERVLALDPRHQEALCASVYSRKLGEADRHLVEALKSLLGENLTAGQYKNIHRALGKALDDLADYQNAMLHFDEAAHISARIQASSGRSFDRAHLVKQVDFIIRTCTPEFFAAHAGYGSESELPVQIVGMARSGTTLVEQILSSHSQVAPAGEVVFWITPGTEMLEHNTSALVREQVSRLADAYLSILRPLSEGARRATDKMPNNHLWLGLTHLVFPNARLIRCRRNPIDNCLSIFATAFLNWADFPSTREDIVFHYRHYERLMRHWREVLPANRFLEVDYEALVSDAEETTRRMIAFCGLDWEDACLHHERNKNGVTTPSMWQVRQPIYKTSVERWRRYEPWLGAFRDLLGDFQDPDNQP